MSAAFSRKFQPIVGVGDVARVNKVLKRVEVIGAVEKESSSLGEKQAKGVVDIELRSVGLNLREIWV